MWLSFSLLATLINVGVSLSESAEYEQNELLSPSVNRNQNNAFINNKNELPTKLKQRAFENMKDHLNWDKFNYKVDQNLRSIPANTEPLDDTIFDYLDELQTNELDEATLNQLSNYLSSLLSQPIWNTPLVIVEDPLLLDEVEDSSELDMMPSVNKRSRYYRRYPWKRQHSRPGNSLDYESLHLCTPSRNDVYQLLVALHQVRNGEKQATVNFCKRRRPVSKVFTSIRFLGRRK
ncbi:GSCOCG00004253001-RA-CDS [Cotesia congregata]|nr:GSCOCG00004253001-RA-CDS [Cotesia congregata]